MQFIMGLNDSYRVIRSQLHLMNPLSDVTQAYSSIIQEEKQLYLGTARDTIQASTMVTQKNEPIALVVYHKQCHPSRFNSIESHCIVLIMIEIIIQKKHVGSYTVILLITQGMESPRMLILSPMRIINFQQIMPQRLQ